MSTKSTFGRDYARTTCVWCGEILDQPLTGRHRRYCTTRHRSDAYKLRRQLQDLGFHVADPEDLEFACAEFRLEGMLPTYATEEVFA